MYVFIFYIFKYHNFKRKKNYSSSAVSAVPISYNMYSMINKHQNDIKKIKNVFAELLAG